jgi:hypothetical protein
VIDRAEAVWNPMIAAMADEKQISGLELGSALRALAPIPEPARFRVWLR